MTVLPTDVEALVKSPQRVRDLGEVFTSATTVEAMLDLIPAEMWQPHPSAKFLEPACGDGNFLVAILKRKLDTIARDYSAGTLQGGSTPEAAQFHALQALASIYAVDLSADNVIGGTPRHEIGARDRLITMFSSWHNLALDVRLGNRSPVLASGQWIVDRNILVGSMLKTPDRTEGRREDLPLVDYDWKPAELTVSITSTTMGMAMAAGTAATNGVFSLFSDEPGSPEVWTGRATELHKAPMPAPVPPGTAARNGNGRAMR